MKKILVLLIVSILFLTLVNAETYTIRIGDTILGTSIVNKISPESYHVTTTIDYGIVYTVESTTTYNGEFFKNYLVTFTVDGTVTAKISGQYDGTEALFVFETPQSSKTFKLTKKNLIILDNNFMIPHYEKLLETPSPIFEIVIPQALFNPGKTKDAVGIATLKKLDDSFQLLYKNEKVNIEKDESGIVKMEFPGFVTVERSLR
ncbi:hypothetical protein JYK00_04985 [Thermosipho ferrireducens]|uniref:Uncharacterized protein n=1 Tax=Thermosipho ferrireducens TaxID=2571116 RepID=A0ABX7S6A9_9BACT|nr:hypothetical protein [Thermosipho ferrireducens]QTA37112.1 hypothetical protein JYK00_04985 [Thermosipho ferrireducens]